MAKKGNPNGYPNIRTEDMMSEEEINKIEELASTLSPDDIADYLGIHRATFYEMVKRNPNISRLYKKGRATYKKRVADHLMSLGFGKNSKEETVSGNPVPLMFYLKCNKWNDSHEQAYWQQLDIEEIVNKDPELIAKEKAQLKWEKEYDKKRLMEGNLGKKN